MRKNQFQIFGGQLNEIMRESKFEIKSEQAQQIYMVSGSIPEHIRNEPLQGSDQKASADYPAKYSFTLALNMLIIETNTQLQGQFPHIFERGVIAYLALLTCCFRNKQAHISQIPVSYLQQEATDEHIVSEAIKSVAQESPLFLTKKTTKAEINHLHYLSFVVNHLKTKQEVEKSKEKMVTKESSSCTIS